MDVVMRKRERKKVGKGQGGEWGEGRGGSYKVRKRRMVRKNRKGVNKIGGKIKEVIGKEKRENGKKGKLVEKRFNDFFNKKH